MKILIPLCLFLAGCASNSANPKIRISNVGTGLQIGTVPVLVAQTLGYYQQEGIEVEVDNLPSSSKALQSLVGGSADVASILYAQTIQIAAEGQHVRSFFVNSYRGGNVLVVSPAATNRIRRIEDLKGALIGVGAVGSASQLWLTYLLRVHGIPPAEVSTTTIGLGAAAIAAVESGRIDAASLSGGDHFHLRRRHPEMRILADLSTPEGLHEVHGDSPSAYYALVAKPEWLARNPDSARRLARAMRRSLQWIAAHKPDEIRQQLPEMYRTPDAAMDVEILQWGKAFFSPDGSMPQGAPETMKRYLDATLDNVRNAKIDLASTWTNEFLPPPN